MSDAITIRPAAAADLPAVAKLAAALVRQHHAIDPRRYLCVEPIEPGYARYFSKELENDAAIILVAARGAAILGYTYARMEPRDWNALLDRCAWLHDIFVEEGARRGGTARRLLDETIRAAQRLGAPRLMLLTAVQNQGAQALFESFGFRRTMLEMALELETTNNF